MKRVWTAAQQQAIDARGKNLLISAAAGSGKTAVLVERIVNLLIEERVGIDHMLIVTFTNAAAGEMKERIQSELQNRRQENLKNTEGADVELADFLSKQIQNVPSASISTVHSFCMGVLRDHFSIAGIDPAFKLLNESYGAILRDEAMDLTFEKKYDSEDEDFHQLVSGYSEAKGDRNVRDLVKNIDFFVQAQPFPEQWLQSQADFYELLASKDDLDSMMTILQSHPLGEEIRYEIRHKLADAIGALQEALERSDGPQEYSFVPKLQKEQQRLIDLQKKLEQGIVSFYKDLHFEEFERFSKKKQEEVWDWEEIKSLRNEAKKIYTELTRDKPLIHLESFVQDMKHLSKMVRALVDLVFEYQAQYRKLKEDNAVLDFSDLEHLALKVLEDEEVRRDLREKFRYIFYDEYQDTNSVQEAIVNSICRENNLFFVGDVKQSIYRFRLADPTIFNEKYALYAKQEKSDRIDLSQNFRSRKEILAFCNLIFENIMSERYGEVNYKNPSHQLYAGRETLEKGAVYDAQRDKYKFLPYQDHIELAIIEKPKKERTLDAGDEHLQNRSEIFDSGSAEEMLDKTSIELEAIYTAQKIEELVAQGVSFKQIAILFRSVRGKASIFEKILAQRGIPSYVDYSSSHYDKLEIKCLLDYLRIVDNKKQDEALLGAMSSMFGGFDNEELIQIRRSMPTGNFYMAAEWYAQNMQDELAEKLRRFYQDLAQAARREKMTALDDFIWHIVQQSGFYTYVSGLEEAHQRLHNIKSFVEKAKEYDQSQALGLFGFLRHIESILKKKTDGGDSTILESENVVRIMSIHKSKGLEFDTVFVCDLGKRINEQDLNADIILHNRLGLGLKYKNSELGVRSDNALRMVLRNQKQRENISEEIRILYVALTRAVNRLYLVSTVNNLEKYATNLLQGSIEKNIFKSRTYLSWIGNALIRNISNPEYFMEKGYYRMEGEVAYQLNLLGAEELSLHAKQLQEQRPCVEDFLTDELPHRALFERYQEFDYPFAESTKRRSKTSVTELTKEYKNREKEENQTFSSIKQPVFSKRTEFSPSELGTLVHFLMENILIQAYDSTMLDSEIERLVGLELLTPTEAAAIPKDAVRAFFDSELGKRMIASENVYRERAFLMLQEEDLVEGVIDCYFTEGDEIVILDYKTDRNIDLQKHREQLQYYKTAVESMEKKKVKEAYIYWIRHDEFSRIL